MGCHFLLQGTFLTQGLNPHLLHWQAESLPLSHLGSPVIPNSIIPIYDVIISCSGKHPFEVQDRPMNFNVNIVHMFRFDCSVKGEIYNYVKRLLISLTTKRCEFLLKAIIINMRLNKSELGQSAPNLSLWDTQRILLMGMILPPSAQ